MKHNTRENIEKQKKERNGLIGYNKQGSKMQIIQYINAKDITVQFLDDYKAILSHRMWNEFKNGTIINPYFPSVYGVGMIGAKYPAKINKKHTKEYMSWHSMMVRCYSPTSKEYKPTYENINVCNEWKLFENFYDWLHTQDNVHLFNNETNWQLDKDIIFKNNDLYCPERCVLVPKNINILFLRRKEYRGQYPIGVYLDKDNYFRAQCRNPFENKQILLGRYNDPNSAFNAYKKYKEEIIKRVAEDEYSKGRITKICYDTMMNYEVEITD